MTLKRAKIQLWHHSLSLSGAMMLVSSVVLFHRTLTKLDRRLNFKPCGTLVVELCDTDNHTKHAIAL